MFANVVVGGSGKQVVIVSDVYCPLITIKSHKYHFMTALEAQIIKPLFFVVKDGHFNLLKMILYQMD